MKKPISVLLMIGLLISSCEHPEGKLYKRNQGSHREFQGEGTHGVAEEHAMNTSVISVPSSIENRNVLQMEVEDGVRYVWIEINGIRLRFIFDTGASTICISPAEATVLYRQGTLRKDDILSVEYFQDATGKISEGTTINLREVKVGSMNLEDVKAVVVDNVNAPLLLGQTVLERFGRIKIDNMSQQIIFK